MRRGVKGAARVLVLIAGAAVGGCASAPVEDAAPGAGASASGSRPSDFTLAVTVRGSSPARAARSGSPAPVPPGLRPARYVIEADGVLRAALGPGANDETFPAATRRLDSGDLDRLWAIVARAGWLDADPQGVGLGAPGADVPTAGSTVAVSGHGAQRTILASRGDASARALAEALAGLAWQIP